VLSQALLLYWAVWLMLQDSAEDEEEVAQETGKKGATRGLSRRDKPRYERRVRQTVQRYSPPKDDDGVQATAGKASGKRRHYQQDLADSSSDEVRRACSCSRRQHSVSSVFQLASIGQQVTSPHSLPCAVSWVV
jgi:hypothetical protein